jgi:hypothetical protein
MYPSRTEAAQRVPINMSVPIKNFGKVMVLFTLYARKNQSFDAEEIALLKSNSRCSVLF